MICARNQEFAIIDMLPEFQGALNYLFEGHPKNYSGNSFFKENTYIGSKGC